MYHNTPLSGVYAGPLPGLDRWRLWPGAVPAELLLGGGARGVPVPVGRGRRQRRLLRVAGPAHLSPAANHQVGYIHWLHCALEKLCKYVIGGRLQR